MYSDHLIQIANLYAQSRKVTMGTLGTYAAADGKFFPRLSKGRVTIRRAERVLQWFSDNWPADLPWPDDIPRPTPNSTPKEAA